MKGLSRLTIEELVRRYTELSLRQKEAADIVNISKVNSLGQQIYEIVQELQKRAGDQRTALVPLLNHPNLDVRFNAATATINVAPL